MNLFLKGNSYPVVNINKFLSQLYVTTQPRRAISSRRLFQRLNPSRVILRINTCRAETSYYALRRVVRANHSESIVRPSEVCSTLVSTVREFTKYIMMIISYYSIKFADQNILDLFNYFT